MRKMFVAALVGFLATTATGFASTSFDGVWRVKVSAQTADARCKERSVSLRVEDGQVRYDGLLGVAKGSVEPSGRINVKIAKVRVDGMLSEASGTGAWRSKNCSGTWMARRT